MESCSVLYEFFQSYSTLPVSTKMAVAVVVLVSIGFFALVTIMDLDRKGR